MFHLVLLLFIPVIPYLLLAVLGILMLLAFFIGITAITLYNITLIVFDKEVWKKKLLYVVCVCVMYFTLWYMIYLHINSY